jgi:hypothetical protein
MKNDIQLWVFNSFIGNPKGFKLIVNQFGWAKGAAIVLKMQLDMLLNNPFNAINVNRIDISWKERLSQKQILPAFILYDTLISKGYSIDESALAVENVVTGVANEFLKFTVPAIKQQDIKSRGLADRKKMFSKIVDRFPNTFGTLSVDEHESYHFTVDACLFAAYCKQLGYENLGPIFCKADKMYFDQHQPNVEFNRVDTLAMNGKPCDFSFNLVDPNIIAKG